MAGSPFGSQQQRLRATTATTMAENARSKYWCSTPKTVVKPSSGFDGVKFLESLSNYATLIAEIPSTASPMSSRGAIEAYE